MASERFVHYSTSLSATRALLLIIIQKFRVYNIQNSTVFFSSIINVYSFCNNNPNAFVMVRRLYAKFRVLHARALSQTVTPNVAAPILYLHHIQSESIIKYYNIHPSNPNGRIARYNIIILYRGVYSKGKKS